jgi:glycosyltransferase involved in cell wall biosynthesis
MRVTVVIPCHNAASFIRATLRSALDQTRSADEILVIDDGSTDDSAAIAASFGAPVRVIRQSRRGISGARNRGLNECTGQIVAYLDADDLWHRRKLERQLDYVDRNAKTGVVTCNAAEDENGLEVRVWTTSDALVRGLSPPDLLYAPLPAMSSTMLVAGANALGVRFSEDLTDSEDMVYAAVLRTQTTFGHVEETLATYRHHPNQLTADPEHWHRRIEGHLRWVEDNYSLLGAPSVSHARAPVLTAALEGVMRHYWARDVRTFRTERRWLLRVWPGTEPIPADLQRIVWPVAMLTLRDWLASRRRYAPNGQSDTARRMD